MSVGIQKVEYTTIAGGQEFAEWIDDNFEEIDGKSGHFYISLEEFKQKWLKTSNEFMVRLWYM